MSITIQIIQGMNAASSHVIEKRFSPVGQASHCEVKLQQPDVPDIACLLEYDSVQGTLLVQCLHADLVFLNDHPLEQHAKVRWSNQQELRIGLHCRLYIGDVPSTVKNSSKNASRDVDLQKKATHTATRPSREETVKQTSRERPSQPPPQRETVAKRSNQEIEAMNREAAKKKSSQMIYIALIALCVIGAIMMLMVDTPSTDSKKMIIRYGHLDNKLLKIGDDHKGVYRDIRMSLNKAHKEGNTSRSRIIYLNLKDETERRLKNSTSFDTELDREIVDYINQQLL